MTPSLRSLTPTETAKRLGVNVATLGRWRQEGRGPAYHRFGKAIRYDEQDLEAFIASCRTAHDGIVDLEDR